MNFRTSSKSTRINYWAVITTGLIAFTLSLLWYSTILFGDVWLKYRVGPPPLPDWTMIFAPLRELVSAYVLALLITQLTSDVKGAIKLILILWLAFYAVGMTGAVIWDNMPWQLGAVHAGDWLMKMIFMGIILSLWHRKTKLIETSVE